MLADVVRLPLSPPSHIHCLKKTLDRLYPLDFFYCTNNSSEQESSTPANITRSTPAVLIIDEVDKFQKCIGMK